MEPTMGDRLPRSIEPYPFNSFDMPQVQHINPLQEVGTKDTPLLDRILMVEETICSENCGSYPHNFRVTRWETCQSCHCDTMCKIYRDCCPDVLLKYNVTYDDSPIVTDCVTSRPVVLDPKYLSYKDYYAMVTKCPRQDQNSLTSSKEENEKCENPDLFDRQQSFPVTSAITGFTYRNIYCSRCHNDSLKLEYWSSSVHCHGSAGPLISTTTTREDLYRKLVTKSSVMKTRCELQYTSPSSADGQMRTPQDKYRRLCTTTSPPIIDVCNATGQSTFRIEELEEACALYDSVFDGRYRNMFCFLCNQEYPYSLERLRQKVHGGLTNNAARVSFAALFDFDGRDALMGEVVEQLVDLDQCAASQFFDIVSCECRQAECSEGKYLDANGTCHSLIKSDLLGYTACYKLDIFSEDPISEDSVHRMLTESSIFIDDDVKEHRGYVLKFCPGDFNVSFYFKDQVSKHGILEDFEEIINSTFEQSISIAKRIFKTTISPNVTIIYPCLTEEDIVKQCPANLNYSIDSTKSQGLIPFGARKDIYYINFTQISTCTFASLFKINFTSVDNGLMLRFAPTGNKLLASQASLVVSSDNTDRVRLCLIDYKELAKTASCQTKTKDFDTWTISGIVSIVCTCVSLFCLALTFFTYLILKPLRTGGGLNIMTLTVLLFIAQALYEFAIEQFENKNICRAIGIAIHYSWLAAVFSMNACTVERFFKLCYPLHSRSFFLSKKRPFMLATSYSLFCPLVIVVINIAANLKSTGDLGYGSRSLCYITSRVSRIASFAAPMGIIVIANVVLLIIAVSKLRQRSGSDGDSSENSTNVNPNNAYSKKNNKVGLLACVKLSVVTGITWLLAFFYEVIPSEALSYIITALIGLQGLLFFLSMIVNKRVMKMFQSTMHLSSSSGTASTGLHSKKVNLYGVKEKSGKHHSSI
ncbi:adhesion g protein-coupled receptor e1 [Plakobranchus ocellatus]|uniref:Adhesion g protein-coupled receptor e1 n=1 Tax=Plakobranchus ocellatus TaxID=259542 RepID=A0AAV4ADZ9_9GAST|nr:adhesion g protein-coupled receptor e1 [Plakobranchus ocellatus]